MNPPYALACNECGTVETGLGFEAAIGYGITHALTDDSAGDHTEWQIIDGDGRTVLTSTLERRLMSTDHSLIAESEQADQDDVERAIAQLEDRDTEDTNQ